MICDPIDGVPANGAVPQTIAVSTDDNPIIALSGPSGSGKTTCRNMMVARQGDIYYASIAHTTRLPRMVRQGDGKERTEQDGVDYYFCTPGYFGDLLGQGMFYEHDDEYPGGMYATSKDEVHKIWNARRTPTLAITRRGVRNLRGKIEHVCTIYLGPRNIDELRSRLLADRPGMKPESLEKRLEEAKREMESWSDYCEYGVIAATGDTEGMYEKVIGICRPYLSKFPHFFKSKSA